MTVLLPSRLGMPSPGVVPQFSIELDPSHPLTKHVAHFFVVSAVYPGGVDLATRKPANVAAGLTTTPANGFYSSANTERVFADPAKVALDSGTVILRYKEDGGGPGTDDCTFLFWKGPNKYMKRRSTDLIWELDVGNAQWKPRPTINAFDGNWHDIGWRWDVAGLDNGKGVDLLIDTEIKSDGTTMTPSATTVTEVSLLSSYHGSVWVSVGGEVPYYIILDRPVSQAVLRSLNADPFQLCRPVVPISAFVPAGGIIYSRTAAIAGQSAVTASVTSNRTAAITGTSTVSAVASVIRGRQAVINAVSVVSAVATTGTTFSRTAAIAGTSVVTATVSFTITRFPAGDLLPGENCFLRVSWVPDFGVTDPYDEVTFTSDFGDSGATYTIGGGGRTNDANTMLGWTAVHAWETAGSKTVTMTGKTVGGTTKQKTESITVMDPDVDITWDNDVYVSFAGDFSGAPAAGGAVQHISNITALLAFGPSAGENTRITFRRGETFTWVQTTSGVLLGPGNITYIQGNTWGTGNRAKIVAGAPLNDNTLTRGFDMGSGAATPRVVAVDIEFDGLYDPTTGIAAAGSFNPFYCINYTTGGGSVSLHKVVSSGCEVTMRMGGGGAYTDNKGWFLASDCHISNWENFGIFSGWSNPGLVGNSIKQHPRALLRPDDKIAPPQAADHGPYRGSFDFACVSNNTLASTTGWSPGGSNNGEGAPQPCLRMEVARFDADAIVTISDNISWGTQLAVIGEQASGTQDLYGLRAMCEGNEHNQIRYWGPCFSGTHAGLYLRNNIAYYPDLLARGSNFYGFLRLWDPLTTGTVSTETRNNPITLRNNTVFSHGAVSGLELIPLLLTELTRNPDPNYPDWIGTTPTETGNIMEIPNHPNVADYTNYTLISAGDRFKPVTGSTAIDAVASGIIPVYDIDGNARALPSNAGAHDTNVASATPVTAPSNSVLPTIVELSSFPNEYACDDFGTWANWTGDQEYYLEYQWLLDAVLDEKTCVYDSTGKIGTWALNLVTTNRSGTRVAATSIGSSTVARTAAIAGTSTVAATASIIRGRQAAIAGTTNVAAISSMAYGRLATITNISTVTATGALIRNRQAAINAVSTVSAIAAGDLNRSIAINAVSVVTATGGVIYNRQAGIACVSTVIVASGVVRGRQAAVAGTSSVAATSNLIRGRQAVITGQSVVSATASTVGTISRTASITAGSTVTANASLIFPRSSVITGQSTIAAQRQVFRDRQLSIAATSAIVVNPTLTSTRNSTINAVSSVSINASLLLSLPAMVDVVGRWTDNNVTATWKEVP